jgi:CheY-like chemotaxis protein
VLVVEHRDEVFNGLRVVLEEANLKVERAKLGGVVAAKIRKSVPGLILVNERMPDESGWLITCKLRLSRHAQPVWLYTLQRAYMVADWKEISGVDEVINYDGVLPKLFEKVRGRLRNGPNSFCESLAPQSKVSPLVA